MKTKISAIIPCYNEEDCIRKAIESVLWADEILIVDSFSTDETLNIISEYPQLKLLQHEYKNSAAQKNWAIPQVINDWIFLLDADEIASENLIQEILALDLSDTDIEAYDIPRQNYFFGKKLHRLYKSDSIIRLFRKQLRYQELEVHAEIVVSGKVGRFTSAIEHHSFKSMKHYLKKIDRYAFWSAKDYDARTRGLTPFHFVIKPIFRFVKHYIIQGGIIDGRAGFLISSIQAYGVFLRYVYLWDLRRQKKKE